MPGAHAVYAPSSSDRWIKCTASAQAISALPTSEEGDEAKEGTDAHTEIDRCLGPLNNCIVDGAAFRAHTKKPDPTHPAAYGIGLFIDYISQLPVGRIWVEQRVRLTEKIWGRLDCAHYEEGPQVLTIADYKNGFVPVDADASQFRIYAAAVILTFGLKVKWIRYACIQPNDFRPVPRIKQMVESAETLHKWASKVAAIPDGPLVFKAGEHCRYCPLFGKCEASKDVLTQLAAMITLSPGQIRPDQVATFMACEKPIADWFKALNKAETAKAVSKGTVPPGMALVTGQKHRAWRVGAEEVVRAELLRLHGSKALDVPTPAQVEKLALDIDIDALAERPEGGPVLAFESDSRPRWARKTADQMFAGLGAMMVGAAAGSAKC